MQLLCATSKEILKFIETTHMKSTDCILKILSSVNHLLEFQSPLKANKLELLSIKRWLRSYLSNSTLIRFILLIHFPLHVQIPIWYVT